MNINKKQNDTGFTQVPISVLNSNDLSFKAKGIYCLILKLNNEENSKGCLSAKEISKHTSCGIEAIKSGLRELEQNKYLIRKPVRRLDGTFKGYNYVLSKK